MADRSSAALFAMFFEALAEDATEERREIARAIWQKRCNYDFCDEQMCCDDALIALGLARKGVDPKYPDDGEITIYCGEDS